ncbi:MAG: DUF1501 domain-containing protein, partial [Pirellulaceae bacterium]
RRSVVRRRDFLRAVSWSGAAAAAGVHWTDRLSAHAADLRQRGMACILLWMQGGPSQFETWDPKPGHAHGGDTRGIATSVPGITLAEYLPELAQSMDELCILRTVNSREGNHPRATYLMHTGYLPTASIKHPTLGAIVTRELGRPDFDLPGFVRIGEAGAARGSAGGGYLGVAYDPFAVQDPARPPNNTTLPGTVTNARFRRRMGLLDDLEAGFEQAGARQEVRDHKQLYDKASRLVLSPRMSAFDLEREPESVRAAYGESAFASGCLLARRLVEAGITFVEVTLGNWDTHDNNFERCRELCEQMDRPYAALLRDLRQRGLLDKTLVVWMGEFGRTPQVNPRGGRDHYPRAFSTVLAGAGIRGGQVIGRTSPGGDEAADRPVGVNDLLRTICHGLGVDADKENMSNVGRPMRIVDGGDVVSEAFG